MMARNGLQATDLMQNRRGTYYTRCKVVLVLNQLFCHEDAWVSGGTTPPFLTMHETEVSGQLHALGKEPLVPTGQEAQWAPGPVWKLWTREKNLLHLPDIKPWPSSL
jgi:hypothetical protein